MRIRLLSVLLGALLAATSILAATARWKAQSLYPRGIATPSVSVIGDVLYTFGDDISRDYHRGSSGFFDTVWILDTVKMTWNRRDVTGDLPPVMGSYCSIANGRKILLFGGFVSDANSYSDDLYEFDVDKSSFHLVAPRSSKPPRRSLHSCFVWRNSFHVYGGYRGSYLNDIWAFDQETNTWSEVLSQSTAPVRGNTYGALDGDVFYIMGGDSSRSPSNNYDSALWSFDLIEKKWQIVSEFASLKPIFQSHVMVVNKTLYSFGGSTATDLRTSIYRVIDVEKKMVIQDVVMSNPKNPMPFPITIPAARSSSEIFSVRGLICIFGGMNAVAFNDIWCTAKDQTIWTVNQMELFPLPRDDSRVVKVSETEFLVYGGMINLHQYQPINDIWKYNLGSNTWQNLARESNCVITAQNCAPLVYLPAVSHYQNVLYVIGGDSTEESATQFVAMQYDLGKKKWQALSVDSAFLNNAGKSYGAAFVSIGKAMYIWGGYFLASNTGLSTVHVLNMDSKTSSVGANPAILPPLRWYSAGFVFTGRFCVYGGRLLQTDFALSDMWCYDTASNTWSMIDDFSAIRIESYGATVEVHQNPILFGGWSFSKYGSYSYIFNGNEWYPFNAEVVPSVYMNGATAKLGTSIVMFAGSDAKGFLSNSVYLLDLGESFCRREEVIINPNGVVEDGSGSFNYFPDTACSWIFEQSTYLYIESIDIRRDASISLEMRNPCDGNILLDGLGYDKISVTTRDKGRLYYIPSGKFRLVFQVKAGAIAGPGFRFRYFACQYGYIVDVFQCICPTTSFVNFAGECIPCPSGLLQSQLDKTKCIPPTNGGLPALLQGSFEALPGDMIQLTSYPPALLHSAAVVDNNKAYLIGGATGVDDSGKLEYMPMDQIYMTTSLVQTEWVLLSTTGQVPKPRFRHCLINMDGEIYVIGGVVDSSDRFGYYFSPSTKQWVRKSISPIDAKGPACARRSDSIIVYGGENADGQIQNVLWRYIPSSDEWRVLDSSVSNPKVTDGFGFLYRGGLMIFSGFDGQNNIQAFTMFEIGSSVTVSSRNITTTPCVACDDVKNGCRYGRRSASAVIYGTELHVYGGLSSGIALQDMLIISLETLDIIYRQNYVWKTTTLPIQFPPPKYGATSILLDGMFMMMGGATSATSVGSDTWTWSARNRVWADGSLSHVPLHRIGASFAKTSATEFVIFGGSTLFADEVLLNDVWRFSTSTRQWARLYKESDALDGPPPRSDAVSSVDGNRFIVVGGRTYLSVIDSRIWIFDLESLSWSNTASSDLGPNQRPLNRNGLSHAQLGASLLIWGGRLAAGLRGYEVFSSIFDLALSNMTMRATVSTTNDPDSRLFAAMCAFDSKSVFLYGGEGVSSQKLSDTWLYNLEKNSWQQLRYKSSTANPGSSMSLCLGFGSVSIVYGGSTASSIVKGGWMYQHDTKTAIPIKVNPSVTYSSISHHSGSLFYDHIILFSGRNGLAMTNQVVAYRPALCSTKRTMIESTFVAAQFDDGSADANYLDSTNCTWVLPSATHIRLVHQLRMDDRVQIFEGALSSIGQTAPLIILQSTNQSTSQLQSDKGFTINFWTVRKSSQAYFPCQECKGFTVTHAACPPDSSLKESQCTCNEGFYWNTNRCYECQSTTVHPDCPLPVAQTESNTSDFSKTTLAIILGVGIPVLFSMFGLFAVKQLQSRRQVAAMESILYQKLDYKDLDMGEQIGYGSFGKVFRAKWRGSDVAVKVLPDNVTDARLIESFMAEIGVMVQLRHPNVLLYMGASVNPPNICIVCELMTQNLHDLLQGEEVEIGDVQSKQFMMDIAKGMRYLHTSNPPILHRDLKSLNVLVDESLKLKVSDFGLTEFQNKRVHEENGSLLWMAPEILDGQAHTKAADVYSYAIVVWEIITRKEPYHDVDNLYSLPHLVKTENKRPLVPTAVNSNLKSLLQNCWAQDPTKRWTFDQIISDLEIGFVSPRFSISRNSVVYFNEIAMSGQNMAILSSKIFCSEHFWELDPSTMLQATMAHNDFIRTECTKKGGKLFQTELDHCIVAFQDCQQAVTFANIHRQMFSKHSWKQFDSSFNAEKQALLGGSTGPGLQMALHIGACSVNINAATKSHVLEGEDVPLTTRIGNLANRNQILVSGSFHKEVQDKNYILPANMNLMPVSGIEGSDLPSLFELTGLKELENGKDASDTRAANQILMSVSEKSEKQQGSTAAPGNSLDGWRVSWSEVELLGKDLGTGSFGTVTQGKYKGQLVAIKKIMKQNKRDDFFLPFYAETLLLKFVMKFQPHLKRFQRVLVI
eukprot:TRINITY_DN2985_c0_g1_i4.p1 TRINITY_DN2985_c0_g1~~TRINITY_DN2985_c0_g1_i4.p1  ORF type:complete len:2280 (+),score=353.77 TRINITY_DN2985_c0_g1_i4:93-6932(+)